MASKRVLSVLALALTSSATSTSKLFTLRANVTEPEALTGVYSASHIHNVQLAQVWKGSNWSTTPQFSDGCQSRAGFADQYPYWAPYYLQLSTNGSMTVGSSTSRAGYAFHVGSEAEVDQLGRKAVGVGGYSCYASYAAGRIWIEEDAITGVDVLKYDDGNGFGSWFTCSDDDDFIYGPALFYRGPEESHPDGCADVNLIPECASVSYITPLDTAYNATCYADAGSVD